MIILNLILVVLFTVVVGVVLNLVEYATVIRCEKVTADIIKFLFKEDEMAVAYATLIAAGKKEFSKVPARIKDEVKQILIDLDCEYLIEE